MDRASLEQLLGQGLSLAEIGRRFGRHEATVSYWVKKHGLEAANRAKHARARRHRSGRSWRRWSRREVRSRRSPRRSAAARRRCGTGSAVRAEDPVRLDGARIGEARGRSRLARHGDDALCTHGKTDFWLDGAWLLPLQAVSIARCRAGAGRSSRSSSRRRAGAAAYAATPQHARAPLPPCRPVAEAPRDERQGRRRRAREGAGRGAASACCCALTATRRSRRDWSSVADDAAGHTVRRPPGSGVARSGVAQLAESSAVNR